MPYVDKKKVLLSGRDWKVEERVNGQGFVDIVVSDDSGAEICIYRRDGQFKLEVKETMSLGMFQSRPVYYVVGREKKSERH